MDDTDALPYHRYLTGKVVGLAEDVRPPLRTIFTGTLETKNDRNLIFKPMSKNVPLIHINSPGLLDRFTEDPAAFNDKIYRVQLNEWPASSLNPIGHIIGYMGSISNLHYQRNALLKDYGFDYGGQDGTHFPEEVFYCLPKMPFLIGERERRRRLDFTKRRVVSIDPATAKDLDDALSVQPHPKGGWEVNVHIADVTYFLQPNTPLDRVAQDRSTSVYLPNAVIPMLPGTLSEELCSLNPGVDRLAFTVTWRMNAEGKVLDTSFGKSVIRSVAKLAYADAQAIIDGGDLSENVPVYPVRKTGLTAVTLEEQEKALRKEIAEDVLILDSLAKKMRHRRRENGSIFMMDRGQTSFLLDEKGDPYDCVPHVSRDSNHLIEEFMLLANQSVAKKIAKAYPTKALLRNHEEPSPEELATVKERLGLIGIEIMPETSAALQRSIDAIPSSIQRSVASMALRKPMTQAKYIKRIEDKTLVANPFHHYGLSIPLYTHFTSPIRRYADVIVHRQLEAALHTKPSPASETAVSRFAEISNSRRVMDKAMGFVCRDIYWSFMLDRWLKEEEEEEEGCSIMQLPPPLVLDATAGPYPNDVVPCVCAKAVVVDAIVTEVQKDKIKVFSESFQFEKMLFLDDSRMSIISDDQKHANKDMTLQAAMGGYVESWDFVRGGEEVGTNSRVDISWHPDYDQGTIGTQRALSNEKGPFTRVKSFAKKTWRVVEGLLSSGKGKASVERPVKTITFKPPSAQLVPKRQPATKRQEIRHFDTLRIVLRPNTHRYPAYIDARLVSPYHPLFRHERDVND